MPRLRWGLAVLCMGTAMSVAAAQGPRYHPGPDNGLLKDLFGPSKPADAGPDGKPAGKSADDARPPKKRSAKARQHERLTNTYLRRIEVCDRLETIGLESDNAALQAEAERLRDLAWKVYQVQAARLQDADAEKLQAEAPPKKGQAASRSLLPSRLWSSGQNPDETERSASARGGER